MFKEEQDIVNKGSSAVPIGKGDQNKEVCERDREVKQALQLQLHRSIQLADLTTAP